MRSAIFVAPFFAETTVRFIGAAAAQKGVRLGLISQDPVELLPAEVRAGLVAHERVADGLAASDIANAVRELAPRIGRPSSLFGALEQLQEPLAEVREALGIPGASVDVARNFRDKSKMKDVLRAAGVPCARHGLAESERQALEVAARIGFPLIAKPPAGAAARDTYRVDDLGALRQCLKITPASPARPLLLEEFIVGDEHSFDSVMIRGQPVWHSLTHYMPGPLEVMENAWIQWRVLLPREVDHPRYDDIRTVGYEALKALGMGSGLTHMEWFRRTDGSIAVSEVAARPPGAQFTTLMSYAHDSDFYGAWARLMMFDEFEPVPRRYAAGIAYLRGQGSGRVVTVHGLAQAQQELGSLVAEVRLPRQGQMPASSYEGEGYVVLKHPETEVVHRGLRRLIELVRIELG